MIDPKAEITMKKTYLLKILDESKNQLVEIPVSHDTLDHLASSLNKNGFYIQSNKDEN